ncbi:MAG: hypothetical protein ABIM89_15645 [Mycobacteriales bacterium]
MRPALPPCRRLFAAAAIGLCTLTSAAPASAATEPVGGPALAGKGVIVDRKAGTPPLPATVTAEGWVVADLDTGAVLAARNPHGQFLPASTLKTLTALALLPKLNPKKLVKPSEAAAGIGGTKVGIKPGHPVSVDLLFTGMLIYSGNDTATALAEAAGGTATTVALMNAEAQRLQAADTLAVNVSGLDETGQYSSPYDLALMGRAAVKLESYRRYTAIKSVLVPSPTGSFEIANKNWLLYKYEGAFGGKTGFTKRALNTYIGYAERDGRRLVVTLMKAKVWRTEAVALLDWGFSAAGVVTPVGQLVTPLDEIQSSATAAPGATAVTTAVPPATAATSAESPAPASAAPAPGPAQAKPKSGGGFFDWVPSISVRFRWWYVAAPLGCAALIAIGLAAWRARRRRRRGFYMPQTKLRLPVR